MRWAFLAVCVVAGSVLVAVDDVGARLMGGLLIGTVISLASSWGWAETRLRQARAELRDLTRVDAFRGCLVCHGRPSDFCLDGEGAAPPGCLYKLAGRTDPS